MNIIFIIINYLSNFNNLLQNKKLIDIKILY